MIKALLQRQESGDQGTVGRLMLDGLTWRTLELPWRANQKGLSCIPLGKYIFKWSNSPKHGMCYEAQKVPNRTDIQIHSANFAGDESKGYTCQLLGCIALGMKMGLLGNKDEKEQLAILRSKEAVAEFHKATKEEDIEIEFQARKGLLFL